MNRTYSPVALVVDDDPNMVGRVERGFLEQTSLGVLQAYDLRTAASYLCNPDLKIDVLLTDIGFEGNTKADELDLHDGLDLIEYALSKRPDMPHWVLSVNADQPHNRNRAEGRKLPISGWFSKFAVAPHSSALPWAIVERSYLVNTLKRDKDFRDRAKEAGIDIREVRSEIVDEAVAENIRKAIVFSRLTYVTRLPDGYEVIRPIEALILKVDEHLHQASAQQIGLVAHAEGGTAEEAIENLGRLIVDETAILGQSKDQLAGYAAHVKEMLDLFVIAPSPGKSTH